MLLFLMGVAGFWVAAIRQLWIAPAAMALMLLYGLGENWPFGARLRDWYVVFSVQFTSGALSMLAGWLLTQFLMAWEARARRRAASPS